MMISLKAAEDVLREEWQCLDFHSRDLERKRLLQWKDPTSLKTNPGMLSGYEVVDALPLQNLQLDVPNCHLQIHPTSKT